MCRILVMPKNAEREEAIDILMDMLGDNTDGTGYSFVNEWGSIETKRWALPLPLVLKRYKKEFLAHMPHDGWTLIHIRKMSCGNLHKENTHPFEVGGKANAPKWSIVHNGTLKESESIRMGIKHFVKLRGTTDSEVAAHLLNLNGFKEFAQEVDFGGVFIGLKKDNTISIAKTSGQLDIHRRKDGNCIIASSLGWDKYKNSFVHSGYYKYDVNGKVIEEKEKKWEAKGFKKTYHYHEHTPGASAAAIYQGHCWD